jgi:hypothetical protein
MQDAPQLLLTALCLGMFGYFTRPLSYHPDIRLEGLRETMKSLGLVRLFPAGTRSRYLRSESQTRYCCDNPQSDDISYHVLVLDRDTFFRAQHQNGSETTYYQLMKYFGGDLGFTAYSAKFTLKIIGGRSCMLLQHRQTSVVLL